ncbi:MAG TPA: serine/threonine-protein kinase [Acidimicrobiales bacterium]|nr:serine/threonine-protein kinase [Acidimicrobiales bacterium]
MVGTSFVGRELGRYRIVSVVGSGGFATVYRAVDTGLERTVALKVVDPAAHHNPTVARRFLREGQAVASLDHPAVVPVYDAGEDDGVLWLAMRLIEGSSLDDSLRTGRRLTSDQIVAVTARIGGALDHAHGQELVHRDVKPSNILLEDNDPRRAWLVDFGIAATARTMGQYTTGALGTAAYMAPEQARPGQGGGRGPGAPADFYSLACVAFEMITGGRPYPGEDYVPLLMAHVNAPIPRCGHPGVDALMARALAKDPAQRPATGADLARDLRQAFTEGTGTTALIPFPVDAPTQPHRPGDTHTVVAGVAPGPPPTVADPRHDTLMHPEVHRPPPPASPYPAAAARPAQPARSGARRGQVALVAGVAALVVAAVATYLALPRSDGTVEVTDTQGISYRIPDAWGRTQEKPVTEYSVDGTVVATVANFETNDAAAADLLQEASTCDAPPAARSVDGSGNAAACTNPTGDVAVAVGAVRNRQFWVVTVHPAVPADQREAFLDSLRLTDPTT